MISHIDSLKEYDPEIHNGIIFDDFNCDHLFREAVIHLLDIDNDREIHIRYGTARIPKNTKKIFTTNNTDGWIFKEEFLGDRALLRRLDIHHLQQGLRPNSG